MDDEQLKRELHRYGSHWEPDPNWQDKVRKKIRREQARARLWSNVKGFFLCCYGLPLWFMSRLLKDLPNDVLVVLKLKKRTREGKYIWLKK